MRLLEGRSGIRGRMRWHVGRCLCEMDLRRGRKSSAVRCLSLLTAVLLLPGGAARTQEQPKSSSQTRVVTVLTTVRDKHGQVVSDLTKDDFELDEDGRAQTICYFSKESDFPLTLGLLVDTSFSQRRILEKERTASYTFLDNMLREGKDKAFLIHFDREVELLRDMTSSRKKLESALDLLKTPETTQGSNGGSPQAHTGNLLYDAVFLASDDLMKKQQGRKALIILSDGEDLNSKETLENAVWAAQRSDTVIYSILFEDEDELYEDSPDFGWNQRRGPQRRHPEQHVDGEEVLDHISKETGGQLFKVSWREPIEKIYGQIEEELRSQYSLGYSPDKAYVGEGYHKINVLTKQRDLIVQARDGYYASP